MFDSVLIANRGEIALRVLRSARALGLRTIAVYSDADAQSPHVRQADQAVRLGAAPPQHSYLNIDALLAAARATGAQAVHPGYGFLAENADFAQACLDAGLVFVGPTPAAIRAMGDKAGAKRRMRQVGVPCIPGYDGDDQDPARLAAEAARIGWPLMIKATAGGGGRGMRRVAGPQDFAAALAGAQSEAAHAFGDGTVILERAIDGGRHVEVQVFADRHGHAIHLGERDCSVQRRHQKIVEEAPSPAVTPALRAAMGAAAVAAARAIGYEGAGTLEFLLDAAGGFHFMEMNTRLQVEHPVTEALTGLDLVALQLRVAAGEPLPLAQEEVRLDGHAIEVRLCAEDPARQFMPASGTLALWQPPPGVRVEHALASGCAVPPDYDPMIAKLVAHAPTREAARQRLATALAQTVALGVSTNRDFLARCLGHPVFAAGQATTAFVPEHLDSLRGPPPGRAGHTEAAAPSDAHWAALALHLAGPGWPSPLAHRLPCPLRLALDGRVHQAVVQAGRGAQFAVQLFDDPRHAQGHDCPRNAGAPLRFTLIDLGPDHLELAFEGGHRRLRHVRDPASGDLLLHLPQRDLRVSDLSRRSAARGESAGADGALRASTTGRVVALLAQPGETVAAGQALITLEAMKMEHLQSAPRAGRLGALQVRVGDQVSAGQWLAQVEA